MANELPKNDIPGAGCGCLSRRLFLGSSAAAGVAAFTPPALAAAASANRLIDVHHHAIPSFWFNETKSAIIAQTGGRIGPQWTTWRPELSIEAMDRNNVAMALLSISAPGTWVGGLQASRDLTRRSNDYLATVVGKWPGRFGFHAPLALPDIDGSLREIAYAMDELGADGIGLMTSYDGRYLGDALFAPVFEELNRRKAAVYVHPVVPECCNALSPDVLPNFVEFLHDTNRAVLSLLLSGSLRKYSGISFIFSHAGGTLPMMAGRVTNLLRASPEAAIVAPDGLEPVMRGLYYDLANAANVPAYRALTAVVPTSQIVFGTDFPIVPIQATAAGLGTLGMSEQDQAAISRDNMLKLYPGLSVRMQLGAQARPFQPPTL